MNNLSKILLAIIVGLIVAVVCLISCNQNLNRENEKLNHNNEVLIDSVETITTKYGETIFANNSLIVKKNELEEKLGITKKQLKEYEKIIDQKIAYIAQLEGKLSIKDTVFITNIIHDEINNSYTMNYKDDWFSFYQSLNFVGDEVTSQIYDLDMNIPLKVGIGDDYKIFVASPNPYFHISSIEGAVIDKGKFAQKPKRWSIGVYGGFGIHYCLINKQLDLGPQLGFGVSYRIW